MATEYAIGVGETMTEIARELIDRAGSDKVAWAPRPDTHGGGVFIVDDDQAAEDVRRARALRFAAEAERIVKAQRAADDRDQAIDGTGLTPSEAGFPAATGQDPGSPDQGKADDDDTGSEDDDKEPESTPESETGTEQRETPAQRRARIKQERADAAAKAEADAATTEK